MKYLIGVLACLVLIAAAAVGFIYSGMYDIAATKQHTPLVRWALETTMHRSVEARAEEIAVPVRFEEAQVQQGLEHFRETCVTCHGAPGVERSDIGKGLRPEPPGLDEASRHWSTAGLFWIVKNGIRMSGMPAFGPVHSDEELWSLIAFLDRLPDLTPEQYRQMTQQLDGAVEAQPQSHAR